MISLKVEVSLFVPSPEIEDRNEVDAGYWANKMQGLWVIVHFNYFWNFPVFSC
jgi:hypothetical protein